MHRGVEGAQEGSALHKECGDAESGSNSLPQRRAGQLLIQYQTKVPGNTSIIETEQVIFRDINVYAHMQVTTSNKKIEPMYLKENK